MAVREATELYEINDDPKRKEFLDDLFSFMQKRGTPINRLPIMAKSVLDLYELYNLVIARGGLVDVINKKLWQEIIKGLHLPSSITSAAFTLRTQYMKYLYPYECEKRRLSTPAELQAAIDGNRREGRRTTSYGGYDAIARSPGGHPQQAAVAAAAAAAAAAQHHFNPLSLVAAQQQHQRLMSSLHNGGVVNTGGGNMGGGTNGPHHPAHPQPLGQQMNGGAGPLPSLAPSELEARMIEYVKLFNKEIRSAAVTPPTSRLHGDCSPPSATSPLNHLEVSRMTLWNLYNNNQPPPEPQKEPINLSEASSLTGSTTARTSSPAIKREPESQDSPPPRRRRQSRDEDSTSNDNVHLPAHSVPEMMQMSPPISPPPARNTHIKINSRGDARNGDNSLVVSMELNGITYQGVLFAQSSPSTARAAMAS